MGDAESSAIVDRFIRDFGFYTLAEFIPAGLGLIGLIVFTHLFTPAAYGRYALAIVAVMLVSTASFGWLEQAVLRFEANEITIVPSTISVIALLTMGVVLLGTVGFLIFQPVLGVYQPFYVAAVAVIATEGSFRVCRAVFQARMESKAVSIFKILRATFKLSLGVVLSIYVFDSIVGWLWGNAIGCAIAVGIMVKRTGVDSLRLDRKVTRQLANYGLPMIGWLFGFTLLTFVDRFFIEFLQSTAAVGIYASNYALVQVGLPLVLSPVIQAAHPVLMQQWDGNNHGEVVALIAKYSRHFLILGIPATIFAGIISRPLSQLLLGVRYHDGYIIIPIIGLALFIWNFAMLGHKGLELQERTGIMTLGIAIAVVANVGLNFVLIPLYGYVGAALATLASSTLYAGFAYAMSRKTVRWTLSIRTARNTLGAGGGMAIVGLLAYVLGSGHMIWPIAGGIIGSLVYALLLLLSTEITTSEMVQIKSVISERI